MNVFELFAKISLDTGGFSASLKNAESLISNAEKSIKTGFENAGNAIKNGLETAAKIGTAAVGAASAAVVGFGKKAVDAGMSFDTAMSQVAATMGKTNKQLNKGVVTVGEFTGSLRDYAEKIGAETAFSATEAAQGLNILAQAGLTAEQQISSLGTVLDLASAGTLSLDTAASYVTGAVKGFSDSMDNAQYYADLIAKGATLANTSVSGLGEAFSAGAATVAGYGQTAESFTLSLLRLAEQNVTGSEAATSLTRAMADLYTPTKEAKAILDELRISMYENGKQKDFNQVIDELNVALSRYTPEMKAAYESTIFTQYGLKAFQKMTVSSAETVNKFSDGLAHAGDGMGAAAEQAQTQLDNLNGDITIFKSALEGVYNAVFTYLNPALREFVQLGTEGLSGLKEAIKAGDFDSAAQIFENVLTKGLETILNLLPTVLKTGGMIVSSLAKGILRNIPSLLDALADTGVQILYTLTRSLAKSKFDGGSILTNILNGLTERFSQISYFARRITTMLAKGISKNLPVILPAITKFITDIAVEITKPKNLTVFMSAAVSIMKALGQGLLNSVNVIIEQFPEITKNLSDAFGDSGGLLSKIDFSKIFESLFNLADSLSPVVEDLVDIAGWLWENVLSPFIEWAANDILPTAFDGLAATVDTLREALKFLETPAKAVWEEFLQPLASWSGDVIEAALTVATDALKATAKEFENVDWEGYWLDFENFGENWEIGAKSISKSLAYSGKEIDDFFNVTEEGKNWNEFWQNAGAAVYDVKEKISDVLRAIKEDTQNTFDYIADAFSKATDPESYKEDWEFIKEQHSLFRESIDETLKPAFDYISDAFDKLTDPESYKEDWEFIKNEHSLFRQSVDETLEPAFDKVSKKFEDIKTAVNQFKDGWRIMTEKNKQKWNDFKDNWAVGADELKNGVQGLIDGARQWGSDLINNFISGAKEMWDSWESTWEDFGGLIYDLLHHSTPEKGALKDDDKWGGDFVDNFINSAKSRRKSLLSGINSLAEDISGAFSPGQTTFTAEIKGFFDIPETPVISDITAEIKGFFDIPEIGEIVQPDDIAVKINGFFENLEVPELSAKINGLADMPAIPEISRNITPVTAFSKDNKENKPFVIQNLTINMDNKIANDYDVDKIPDRIIRKLSDRIDTQKVRKLRGVGGIG